MHPNFHFTPIQILWTLTFAAQLVLLVVLLGRERIKRFPWFTTSIALLALRLLASRLLFGRMPQMTLSTIFISMAVVSSLASLVVVVELARRAFAGAKTMTWVNGTLGVIAVSIAVLAVWGPWPGWKTLTTLDSQLAVLRLLQFLTQKTDLLAELLSVELALLVLFFGRLFKGGWRSHVQRILIGLSTASMAQLSAQAIWQSIARSAVPHTQAEYEHVLALHDKLFNSSEAIYVAVLVWWIVCLWIDEPKPVAAGSDLAVEWLEAQVALPTPAEEAEPAKDVAEETAKKED
jgi:hypothetical protein